MNKSFWPEDIKQKDVVIPDVQLNMQGEILLKMTEGKILAEANPQNPNFTPSEIRDDFNFEFIIRAPLLKNYTFNVFDMSYPITFFPLRLKINDEILSEIQRTLNEIPGVSSFAKFIQI